MNEVKCRIEGCTEVFQTEESISSDMRFICKNHPRAHQLAAVGRTMKNKDTKDEDVRFQGYQFDKSMNKRNSKGDT